MEFGLTFPSYWEWNNHPNWRSPSFFRGVGWNHQPDGCHISFFQSESSMIIHTGDLRLSPLFGDCSFCLWRLCECKGWLRLRVDLQHGLRKLLKMAQSEDYEDWDLHPCFFFWLLILRHKSWGWAQLWRLPGIGLVLPMYEGTHPKMRKEFKGRQARCPFIHMEVSEVIGVPQILSD